jgi:hypothetical protein
VARKVPTVAYAYALQVCKIKAEGNTLFFGLSHPSVEPVSPRAPGSARRNLYQVLCRSSLAQMFYFLTIAAINAKLPGYWRSWPLVILKDQQVMYPSVIAH